MLARAFSWNVLAKVLPLVAAPWRFLHAWYKNVTVRGIQRAMQKENALLLDAAMAPQLARLDHFTRLGRWLPTPQAPSRVLELGCGPGKYVALLSSLGFEVVGVDPISFPNWEDLKQRNSVRFHDKVFAEKIPFPDQSFDHVTCLGALLYFDDPAQALREVRRVLKPGGKFIVRTVNKDNLYTQRTGQRLDPASKNLYSLEQLAELLTRHGFHVEDSYAYGMWPPFLIDFWWYLNCVWIPYAVQGWLSSCMAPRHRVVNCLLAAAPAAVNP